MAQLMFETFNIPALYIASKSVCPLYSYGFENSLVLNIGHGVCKAIPIYQKSVITSSVLSIELAGIDIDEYLKKLLIERGVTLPNSSEEIITEIKEKLCYVSLDYEMEMLQFNDKEDETFELSDGRIISLGNERIRCPEALFRSSLVGAVTGVHDIVYQSIMKCDPEIRDELFQNILICGGGAMFKDFSERLRNELIKLVPGTSKIKFINGTDRSYHRYCIYGGGSVFAQILSERNPQSWISLDEYQEIGPVSITKNY